MHFQKFVLICQKKGGTLSLQVTNKPYQFSKKQEELELTTTTERFSQSTIKKLSISTDEQTYKMMVKVKQHYGIKSNNDLLKALIKRAYMSL